MDELTVDVKKPPEIDNDLSVLKTKKTIVPSIRCMVFCIVITVLCALVLGLFFVDGYCRVEVIGSATTLTIEVADGEVVAGDPDTEDLSEDGICSFMYLATYRTIGIVCMSVSIAALAAAVVLAWVGVFKGRKLRVVSAVCSGAAIVLIVVFSVIYGNRSDFGCYSKGWTTYVFFIDFYLHTLFYIETVLLAGIAAVSILNAVQKDTVKTELLDAAEPAEPKTPEAAEPDAETSGAE